MCSVERTSIGHQGALDLSLRILSAEQVLARSTVSSTKQGVRQPGSHSEHFNELIDNLVLNQGMKGCNYAIAYEQYEEDSAGPSLPCHVGRGGGPVRARCSVRRRRLQRRRLRCSRGGSRSSTAEDRYRRYGLGVGLDGLGVGHDRAGRCAVLWRDGAFQECVEHDLAELRYPLSDQCPVGAVGLLTRLRAGRRAHHRCRSNGSGSTGLEWSPMPIMRPPYRTRPSCSSR